MADRLRSSSWKYIQPEGNLFSLDILELIARDGAPAQSIASYDIIETSLMDAAATAFRTATILYSDYKAKASVQNADIGSLTRAFIRKLFSKCFEWDFDTISMLSCDGKNYPIRTIAYQKVPLVTAPGNASLDKGDSRFKITNGQNVVSPFQMLQQYLTSSGTSSWGIVANATSIRLLRSSTTLSKPQYLEFDYGPMLEDDSYAEFAILWKILHVSRIRDTANGINLDIWEEWRKTAIDTGERVREKLRNGVTVAICKFGTGFIKENPEILSKLQSGGLSLSSFYHQILLLVYRFIFLFVTEERYTDKGIRLLFMPDSSVESRKRYDEGYSVSRLRMDMRRTKFRTTHTDLWEAQKIVFRALASKTGEPKLGLPPLGGMFDDSVCKDIHDLYLTNRDFLAALMALRWSDTNGQSVWIDFKNLGSQELGSVYESLLELVPRLNTRNEFEFAGMDADDSTRGNERKTTGSYYTPDFMVEQLVKTAVIPVIEDRLKGNEDPEKAILSITCIDPACGSGHFLIAAASTLAAYLAKYRSCDESVVGFRQAYRDVINHCIYGVDLNPMAVELTKMALWLEGYEPGKPLSFLDSHIKCGNSLLGVFDSSILKYGIPSAAYSPGQNDDKKLCSFLKSQNRKEIAARKASADLDLFNPSLFNDEASTLEFRINEMPENTPEEIDAKKKAYSIWVSNNKDSRDKLASDYYLSTFFVSKRTDCDLIPSTSGLSRILDGNLIDEDQAVITQGTKIANENNFFHWKLEFPSVFANNGFDIVLANPPWDKLKLKDEEFFATRIPSITNAQNASKRKKMIQALATGNEYEANIFHEYQNTIASINSASWYYHLGKEDYGQFYLSGVGDVNLYALFSELFLKLKKKTGAAGFIVPTGLVTDDSTKNLFSFMVNSGEIHSVYDFENSTSGYDGQVGSKIFPAVHSSYKFSLVTLFQTLNPDFCFFLHSIKDLDDERRHYKLTPSDIKLFNPNTLTLPLIKSKKDFEIMKKIYQNSSVIWNENQEDGNPFDISFLSLFHMSNDSNLFLDSPTPTAVPLYEGKFLYHYDYRFNSYEGEKDTKGKPKESYCTNEMKTNPSFEITPQYWIEEKEVVFRYSTASNEKKKKWMELMNGNCDLLSTDASYIELNKEVRTKMPKYGFGYRSITNTTNVRTVISTLYPGGGAGHSINLLRGNTMASSTESAIVLNANLSSLALDYAARNKIGGTNLSQFYFKQLPIIKPCEYSPEEKEFVIKLSKKLIATTVQMAEILNCDVTIWNADERALMMAKLDAFYAKKYGLNHDDLLFILDPEEGLGKDYPTFTFPTLKKNDIAEYGEYRTKRLVLEAFDELERNGLWTIN